MKPQIVWSQILIQAGICIIFITYFFFNYVAKIETTTTKRTLYHIVHTLFNPIQVFLSDDQKQQILQEINKQPVGESKPNTTNQKIASEATQLATLTAAILFLMALVFLPTDTTHFVQHAILGVSVVALVEFMFITFFAQYYRVVDTSDVIKALLTA